MCDLKHPCSGEAMPVEAVRMRGFHNLVRIKVIRINPDHPGTSPAGEEDFHPEYIAYVEELIIDFGHALQVADQRVSTIDTLVTS